jgi:two-component system, LuxR family, response regulator FixJ
MTVPWAYRPFEQSHEPICVVDDDESVAHSLKSLLETFGFEVSCYSSGAEFLADTRRRIASCLVLDQHMPGLNGLDVVDHLQKEGVRVPTILISGRLDTNIRERASSLGVTSVIEKPFAADRLVNLIRSALLERN